MSEIARPPVLPNTPPGVMRLDVKVLWQYLKDEQQFVAAELRRRIVEETAIDGILLRSPGGNIYKLMIADDGSHTTTLVQSP